MKKFLVAAMAMFCISSSSFAVEPEEGLTWQGEIGMNVSKFNMKGGISILNDYMSAKPGLNLGVYGRYVLPGCAGVYGKFGVRYDMLGAKGTKDFGLGTEADIAANLHYVSIPVHVGYQYGFTEDFSVHADVGPYFGMGLVGKMVTKTYLNNNLTGTNKDSWFKDGTGDQDMKRLECGLGFNVGCEYLNHYIFNIGCDWGVTNQLKDSNWPKTDKLKNFDFHFSVGYRL